MTFFNCNALYSNRLEALLDHALQGRYFKVQYFLRKGVDPDVKNSVGATSLMMACLRSHREVVELLINSGADIHCCTNNGLTPLYFAIFGGSVEVLQCLVNKGAALDKKNSYGETPLFVAAELGKTVIFEELINLGADIHGCYSDGSTLLHRVAFIGCDVEIVKCLVNKGASVDKKDTDGETPLMKAACGSSEEVVELLINSGANIHSCDDHGWTMLHHAICGESVEVLQCFVNKGVALDMKCHVGFTPLHLAIHFDKIKNVEYLLKAGADCNMEDNDGESPFHFLLKKIDPNVGAIKLCIEKGAYVKSTDYNKLLEDPLLKEVILQDVKLCSQAVINKFNNKDLPLLYQGLASAQKLPHIDKMKIRNGSGMAIEVEQAVAHEIKAKGFCNLFKMVPLALGILCVKSSVENLIPASNGANLSESQNGLKRLGSCIELEYPCKRFCNEDHI